MSDQQHEAEEKHQRPVRYTIDGRPFKGPRKQKARRLLRQAGLKPNGYDLAEIECASADPHVYDDNEVICIDSGDRFISIREQATVA